MEMPSSEPHEPLEALQRAGVVSWSLLGIALLLAALAWLAWTIRILVPTVILAGVIVFLLDPLVAQLERRRIPRGPAVLLAYLAFAGVVWLATWTAGPPLQAQWEDLQARWPELRDELQVRVEDRLDRIPGIFDEEDRARLAATLREAGTDLEAQLTTFRGVVGRLFRGLLSLLLGPIVAFYVLADLPRLRRALDTNLPEPARSQLGALAHDVGRVIGGFLRGQLFIAVLVGLLTALGLRLIDLPFWLLIGLVAGVFNLVPFIGPWIGGIPAVLVALTLRDPVTAGWAILVMVVVQQLESNVFGPVIMHRAVHLPPAFILIALLVGGNLFGFLGLVLAVPTAAVIKVISGHLWRRHVLGEAAA